jgi:hypothetical protein
MTPQPVSNPIPWARQGMRGYLASYRTSTIIESHVEFNCLARPQWWLALYYLIRYQQEVIPMDEEIAIEGCRV